MVEYPICLNTWKDTHRFARKNTHGSARTNSRKFLAAAIVQLRDREQAKREAELSPIAHPHFTIDHWLNSQTPRDKDVRDHFVDSFRKAGLPEKMTAGASTPIHRELACCHNLSSSQMFKAFHQSFDNPASAKCRLPHG